MLGFVGHLDKFKNELGYHPTLKQADVVDSTFRTIRYGAKIEIKDKIWLILYQLLILLSQRQQL